MCVCVCVCVCVLSREGGGGGWGECGAVTVAVALVDKALDLDYVQKVKDQHSLHDLAVFICSVDQAPNRQLSVLSISRAVGAAWLACVSGDALANGMGLPQASMACICLAASGIGLLAPQLSRHFRKQSFQSPAPDGAPGLFTGASQAAIWHSELNDL